MLGDSLAYVVNFDPYQGAKSDNITRAIDKTQDIEETVALSHLDVTPQNICCRVYMDNFFTLLCLLESFASIKIPGSKTVRENWLCNCTITKKTAER